MKTALIIGLNGNFGSEMARAFIKRGWKVSALVRSPEKIPSDLSSVTIHQGDVRSPGSVAKAAQGCEAIVYAAHPAYHRWHEEAMDMLEPVAQAAASLGARLVFPGNVYNFAAQKGRINEDVQPNPPTDKGEVRERIEARLKQAVADGAKLTIVRAGDFLGPRTQFTWWDLILKGKNQRYVMRSPAVDAQHVHYWSYLPDTCENAVQLVEAAQNDVDVYHDPGFAVTQADWIAAFKANGVELKVKSFPWWALKLAAPFNPMFREVLKMRYLWQKNVVLDGSKLINTLCSTRVETPLPEVVKALALQTEEESLKSSPQDRPRTA